MSVFIISSGSFTNHGFNSMRPNDVCMCELLRLHYDDVIKGPMASQIARLTIVYSTVYSDVYQRKHQRFVSLAFVRGIHRVNSPHKCPATQKMFPFDDVIMEPMLTLCQTDLSAVKRLMTIVSKGLDFIPSKLFENVGCKLENNGLFLLFSY